MCSQNKSQSVSKFSKATNATHRISRRKLMRREYSKLKSVIPTLAVRPNASKLDVINETLRYITQLETELIAKMLQKKLAQSVAAVPPATVNSRTSLTLSSQPISPIISTTAVDMNNNCLTQPTNTSSSTLAQEVIQNNRPILQARQLN